MPFRRLNRFKRPLAQLFRAELCLVEGLHGFESHKHFVLYGKEEEAPFLWLESKEDTRISFVVIDPFIICPGYSPKISRADLQQLNAAEDAELILLAIVNTLETPYTMNLAAPLLINWAQKKGKQILLEEDSTHPIV